MAESDYKSARAAARLARREEGVTPEQIEDWRKLGSACFADDSLLNFSALCDLALDGLRFRKWVEAKRYNPSKLILLITPCHTLESYREAIDKFVVERKG